MTSKLEWSHDKRRPQTPRLLGKDDGIVALPSSDDAAPIKDTKTGRFVKGNTAHRLRVLKSKAKGVITIAPASCAAWLRPHVIDGASYGMALLARFPDASLARLVGDVADAHTIYRALLSLGAQGDVEALREARAWLREHRSALATLSGLAGESIASGDDSNLFVEETRK